MEERSVRFARSEILFIPLLFLLNLVWHLQFGFHTLMGDDLVRWSQVTAFDSVASAFTHILDSTKYRPVNDLCHYVLFTLFSHDFQLFFFFNILFNFVIVVLLYWLVRRITRENSILAFAACIVYITSRFAYYNVLQVYGVLEALCLLWLLGTLYCVLLFVRTSAPKWAILASFGYLLLVFTHERYLLILPFLVLAIALFDHATSKVRRVALILVPFIPFVLNLFLKAVVFKAPVAQRTGTIPLELNGISILTKMGSGLSKIAGINVGPDYLNGISFLEQDALLKTTSISIAASLCILLVITAVHWAALPSATKKREAKIFLVWATLLASLLFSASIVSDQEQRWLYSPLMIVLIYLAYLVSRMSFSRFKIPGYCLLTLFVGLSVHNDFYYRRFLPKVYFVRANAIADSFYDSTIGKYGTNIVEKQIFVRKFRDYQWILQDSLFFKPYIPDRRIRITYVDSVDQVPRYDWESDRTLIYSVNEAGFKVVDLKNPDPPVLISFGPDQVKAGEVFNQQPNGESAIWAEANDISPATVFVLNGIELDSTMHAGGKSATAVVPRKLYENPGAYKLYLFDKNTKKKSDELVFVVKR